MGRIIGIDYGLKRCGIAATDILRISINPLKVITPQELIPFLEQYLQNEEVDCLVIGWPTHKDGTESYVAKEIQKFLAKFAQLFPTIQWVKVDEAFSSTDAKLVIRESGVRKKKRRDKALVDQVSAVVLIKRYLDSI